MKIIAVAKGVRPGRFQALADAPFSLLSKAVCYVPSPHEIKESMMTLSDQELWKTAVLFRDRLETLRVSRYGEVQKRLESLLARLEQLRAIKRRLDLCTSPNFLAAAGKVISQVSRILDELPYYLTEVEGAMVWCDVPMPSLRELLAELRQTEDEFSQLRYDDQTQVLSVVTDPIELEDVYLGEFETQLFTTGPTRAGNHGIYQVVALDPHPAASDESVTHPHLKDQCLCPGNAGAAIQSALLSGRICDFFLLVRSVLTQYNPRSPYLSLANWYGVPCYDCGYRTSSEELCQCHSSENDFSDDCIPYCHRCDDGLCQGCFEECPVCKDTICPACLTDCPHCKGRLCETCLDEELCPCNQEEEKENGSEKASASCQAGGNTTGLQAGERAA